METDKKAGQGVTAAVIGAGSWGTVFAALLAANGHKVRIWAREPEILEGINNRRRNPLFSTETVLKGDISATGDFAEALHEAEFAASAIPSKFLDDTIAQIKPFFPRDCSYLSLTKGLAGDPPNFISGFVHERWPELGTARFAVLSGPNLAGEIAAGNPAAAVIASSSTALAGRLQELVASPSFRVYTSGDVLGVEIGGCVKNIIAIAAGITEGLELGVNARSVLITRGLVEMSRLADALGAKPETLMGLSGLGDLIATCSSRNSRNFQVGERLARGERIDAIVHSMNMVAEGVTTAMAVLDFARRLDVPMPITEQVNSIIAEGKSPKAAISELMARMLKPESIKKQP